MIAHRFSRMALAAMIVVASVSMRADTPPVRGSVATIELCQQSVCGFAIFVGVFAGQIGSGRALGTVGVAVRHDELPGPGHSALIRDGVWQINAFARSVHGAVAGGTLFNNGDNTFTVQVNMLVAGSPTPVTFNGLLNHNPFPPQLNGQIQ